MPKNLNSVLKNIRPRPLVLEIAGEPFEFYQLTIRDFEKIAEKTGVDLTKEMLKAQQASDPTAVFSSGLINYILYMSLQRGKKDYVGDLTLDNVGELISYGLKGDALGKALLWAMNGISPDEAQEQAGGSGNRSTESTGDSQ